MTDKVITHGVCKECKKEFDYPLSPGYPRLYCDTCKVAKKAEFDARQVNTPVAPVDRDDMQVPVQKPGEIVKKWDGEKILNMRSGEPMTAQVGVVPERKSVKGSAYEKDPVGLAVEIFCSLRLGNENIGNAKDWMAQAIELVNQARKAFE